MRLLKTINPENIDEKNLSGWRWRITARAVVFDDENKVGLLHITSRGYYKLPGGEIENNENAEEALHRECREELGVEIKVAKEIGSIMEFRAQNKLFQTSHCFLAKTISEKKPPNFSEREKSFGYEIVWTEPNEALKLLKSRLKTSGDYGSKFTAERDLCFFNETLKKSSRAHKI